MHLVILAGGLATRLKTLSQNLPKALIKVGGKPFIFWQLEFLKNQGVKNILICCGHLGEMIQNTVGDGKSLGLNIVYSFDGPILLGTGGAIKKTLSRLPQNFMVMYGDTILSVNFKEVQNAFNLFRMNNVMVVIKNKNKWAPSNVACKNNRVIKYSNKNDHDCEYIDYGLSILSKKSFEIIKEQEFDLGLIFKKLINMNQLSAFEVNQRFYEINTPNGVMETEKYLINNFHSV